MSEMFLTQIDSQQEDYTELGSNKKYYEQGVKVS
jgi:hypothetical protein